MKYIVTIICFVAITAISSAQVIIWQEDFSSHANGTQQNAPDWTTTFADTDDPPPHTVNGSYWGVYNGEFRNNDVEGPGGSNQNYFTTRYFQVAAFSSVSLSVDFRGTGALDCGCGVGCLDEMRFEYSLNGGAWTQFSINGYICADVPNDPLPLGTAYQHCLSGDSVAIRIMAGTQANDENYYFDNVTITGYNTPSVDAGNPAAICAGQSVQLNASGGNNYTWTPALGLSCTGCPNPVATPAVTTQYMVTATDVNGCIQTDSVTITVSQNLSFDLGPDTTVCGGQGFLLDPGITNAAFLWQDNTSSPTYTVTVSGLYYVNIDVNGCSGSDSIQITVINAPTVDLGSDITNCNGSSNILLDAGNPGAQYLWSTSQTTQTIQVSSTGIYSVTVTNNCGTASDQVTVLLGNIPQLDLGPDVSICNISIPYILDAVNPGAQYLWQDFSTAQQFLVQEEGIYHVTVTTDCGSVKDSVIVFPGEAPQDVFSELFVVCGTAPVILDAENPGATYTWYNGETTAVIAVTETGEYVVEIEMCGVTIQDTAWVVFENDDFSGPFLPNTFTPNNDGVNDFYHIGLTPESLLFFECRIYNRWGAELYFTDNPFFHWDGTYNGRELPDGTYYITVKLTHKCSEGKLLEAGTFISLFR